MALEGIPSNLGKGGAHINDKLREILVELQGRTKAIAAGTTSSTNIAVAGITLEDTIESVVEIDIAGDAVVDRTSEASITSDGNIQLDTTDTTGSHLLIEWMDKVP